MTNTKRFDLRYGVDNGVCQLIGPMASTWCANTANAIDDAEIRLLRVHRELLPDVRFNPRTGVFTSEIGFPVPTILFARQQDTLNAGGCLEFE